jgi:hypothetical protein
MGSGKLKNLWFIGLMITFSFTTIQTEESWIRINLLGYKPGRVKVAVWAGKTKTAITSFVVVDASTNKKVFESDCSLSFGEYGPFKETYRLDFSDFTQKGKYYLKAGNTISPLFTIDEHVYAGSADFCLRYMRQQRCGYNPFLQDSCHVDDGYTMYGPMPDSTHIDVVGGWHDASDYLQYVTTSANATYHLMAAWRDYPRAFSDYFLSDGHTGNNGWPDVLDEARWGLDWLMKMHPNDDWMFNQIADDRDHISMRLPKNDDQYGRGFERPVYFCSGEQQGLMKYKNNSNGLASTAGKFSSAFALGNKLFQSNDPEYAFKLKNKSFSAFKLGIKHPGVCQTAPCRAPYYYEEENWSDDMQLAAAAIQDACRDEEIQIQLSKNLLNYAYDQALKEPITPWMISDTARHYQWYPFVNVGHYELAKQIEGSKKKKIIDFYRQGIENVQQRANKNAFKRGIPFIWCSNNLTTSFAIQCLWYKELTGDQSYTKLEQANFDWLFGCNPWGTSFVYGLPAHADTPSDPHSAFTHIGKFPIDGGLVDGPVYTGIFNNLIGITLYQPDEYKDFQSQLAVYHDDYGDYSTNEPTMDGVASLIYLMAAKETETLSQVQKKKSKNR